MLTPTGNLQEWIEDQNKQVRSESDIIIEVWRYLNGTLSKLQTLDKKNIESYTINESSSIVGFRNQSTDINFTIFKDGITENNIKQGYFILIYYRFYIGNSYSDVQKGFYEISKATVQNNGLVAKYEAKTMCYKLLESEWNLGGIPHGSFSSYRNEISSMGRKIYPNMDVATYGSSLLLDYSTNPSNLTNRSVLSLLTSIAQANGVMLRIKGFIDWNNNRYGLEIHFLAYSDTSGLGDYVVDYGNMLKKPENIESEYGYAGVSVKGTISTYRESQEEQPDKEWIEINPLLLNGNLNEIDWGKYPPYEIGGHTYHKVYRWDSDNDVWVLVHNDYPYDSDPIITPYTFTNESLYSNYFKISVSPAIPSDYKFMFMYEAIYSVREYTYELGTSNKIIVNNPFLNNTYNEYYGSGPNYTIFLRCANMFDTFKQKEKMEIECRFDPRVETLDCIIINENEDTLKRAFVESFTMTYNGSFKGKMELVDLGETAQYTITFSDMNGTVFNTQQIWGGALPNAPECPAWTDSSNTVYKSKTFLDWTPSVSTPISADTDFYPIYDYESYYYDELTSYSGNAVIGQICAFTSEAISGDTRRWAYPHIAMIRGLNGSLTIPAKAGAPTRYLSQLPTEVYGKPEYDEWQHNYVSIVKWGATSVGQKYYIGLLRNNQIMVCLCKDQSNKLYYRTPDQRHTPISWNTFESLIASFDYDEVNDCFTFNGSGTIYAGFYKRRTS